MNNINPQLAAIYIILAFTLGVFIGFGTKFALTILWNVTKKFLFKGD